MSGIDGLIGVAVSTTGTRLEFLETAVRLWRSALPLGSVLVVTVDGDEDEARAAYEAIDPTQFGNVVRVHSADEGGADGGRAGVAATKNAGIEYLMDAGVRHLFLSDDDIGPKGPAGIDKHIALAENGGVLHSMVCWGRNRLIGVDERSGYAEWNWPRGVMLYQTRAVIERVGGMDERFGRGGHEHAEWSSRIHHAGMTPAPFCSPRHYALRDMAGTATRAATLWHIEDMPAPGESRLAFARRKDGHTTITRTREDWARIDTLMAQVAGSDAFVPYAAKENGRESATLFPAPSEGAPSRGAGGEK